MNSSQNLSLSNIPQIMGVINLAPGSFFGESIANSPEAALLKAIQMVRDGAHIIDIGAEPTNPGVNPVASEEQELELAIPSIEKIAKNLDVTISIDTSKALLMREAVRAGAKMINDVRALTLPAALETAAELNVAVCLMHMGRIDSVYDVKKYLSQRIEACLAHGIKRENIIIDPGIGGGSFGKSTEQNLALIANLHIFHELQCPLLIGVSRKMFIGDILQVSPEKRLFGSLAATSIALWQGASIVRTHDVKETAETLKIVHGIKKWWS